MAGDNFTFRVKSYTRNLKSRGGRAQACGPSLLWHSVSDEIGTVSYQLKSLELIPGFAAGCWFLVAGIGVRIGYRLVEFDVH